MFSVLSIGFDSKLVRLKVEMVSGDKVFKGSFDSKLVRLKVIRCENAIIG